MSDAPQKSEPENQERRQKRSSRQAVHFVRRESEQRVFDHLEEWANSPGLQPPK
jgi:hypothetical protein